MKTTPKLPDPLFREAKASAAQRGQSLKEFVAEALRDKLALDVGRAYASEPEWMKGFGKLKRLHKETVRVQSVVDQEFEVIEPEDRRWSSVRTRYRMCDGSAGKGLESDIVQFAALYIGGDLATASVPMMPLPPGRLSAMV